MEKKNENEKTDKDQLNGILWAISTAHKVKKNEEKDSSPGTGITFANSPDVSKEISENLTQHKLTTLAMKIQNRKYSMVFPVAQIAQVIEIPKMGMAIKIDLEKYPASGNFVRYIADLTKDPIEKNTAAVIKYFLSLYLKQIENFDRSFISVPKRFTLSNVRNRTYLTLGIVLVAIIVDFITRTLW